MKEYAHPATMTKPVILAVDDDPVIVNSVLSILKNDYSVKPFTSGQTALKYLENHTVDLILLDYQMPGLTGSQVLEKLQDDERTKAIPIIFLTGSIDDNSEVEVLEKGAMDYILKPIKPRVLLTRIHLQLELQGYRNHLETLVENKTKDLRIAYNKLSDREEITMNMLARVTDLRDHDTGNHILRTTKFSRLLAEEILDNPSPDYQLTKLQVEDIVTSVKLHDIGKIAIPDKILLKPAALTPEEFDIIKTHTTHGAKLLDEFIDQLGGDSFLNTARDIALCHHEKWNGAGYPNGLKDKAIPLSARIAALSDVYDALTSTRPYKKSFSHEQASEMIKKDSGTHFDPHIVAAFLKHQKEFESISLTH